jgi:hypothetical protein
VKVVVGLPRKSYNVILTADSSGRPSGPATVPLIELAAKLPLVLTDDERGGPVNCALAVTPVVIITEATKPSEIFIITYSILRKK